LVVHNFTGIQLDRVGIHPGKKVFLPFQWGEMDFYWEENLSSTKKLGRNPQRIE